MDLESERNNTEQALVGVLKTIWLFLDSLHLSNTCHSLIQECCELGYPEIHRSEPCVLVLRPSQTRNVPTYATSDTQGHGIGNVGSMYCNMDDTTLYSNRDRKCHDKQRDSGATRTLEKCEVRNSGDTDRGKRKVGLSDGNTVKHVFDKQRCVISELNRQCLMGRGECTVCVYFAEAEEGPKNDSNSRTHNEDHHEPIDEYDMCDCCSCQEFAMNHSQINAVSERPGTSCVTPTSHKWNVNNTTPYKENNNNGGGSNVLATRPPPSRRNTCPSFNSTVSECPNKPTYTRLGEEHIRLLALATELTQALQTQIRGQSDRIETLLSRCRQLCPECSIPTSTQDLPLPSAQTTPQPQQRITSITPSTTTNKSRGTAVVPPSSSAIGSASGVTGSRSYSQNKANASLKSLSSRIPPEMEKAGTAAKTSVAGGPRLSQNKNNDDNKSMIKGSDKMSNKTLLSTSNTLPTEKVARLSQQSESYNKQKEEGEEEELSEEVEMRNESLLVDERSKQGVSESSFISTEEYGTELDFKKIKRHLSTKSDARKLVLLQALRWRLTQSNDDFRDHTLNSYIRNDLLSLNFSDATAFLTRFFTDTTSENCTLLQESTARLLNAFASLTLGRDYLSFDDDVVANLLIPLVMDCHASGAVIEPNTRDFIFATLQKLSLRSKIRKLMVSKGLVEYVVDFLSENMAALSNYSLEYTTALLMNLCLHPQAKNICSSRAAKVVKLMQNLLNSGQECCLLYANGIMYSLLGDLRINSQALRARLEVDIKAAIAQYGANQELRRQFEVILTLHKTGGDREDICANVEPDEELDILEPELDLDDNVIPYNNILDKYRIKLTDGHVSNLTSLCRPTTPHRTELFRPNSVSSDDNSEVNTSTGAKIQVPSSTQQERMSISSKTNSKITRQSSDVAADLPYVMGSIVRLSSMSKSPSALKSFKMTTPNDLDNELLNNVPRTESRNTTQSRNSSIRKSDIPTIESRNTSRQSDNTVMSVAGTVATKSVDKVADINKEGEVEKQYGDDNYEHDGRNLSGGSLRANCSRISGEYRGSSASGGVGLDERGRRSFESQISRPKSQTSRSNYSNHSTNDTRRSTLETSYVDSKPSNSSKVSLSTDLSNITSNTGSKRASPAPLASASGRKVAAPANVNVDKQLLDNDLNGLIVDGAPKEQLDVQRVSSAPARIASNMTEQERVPTYENVVSDCNDCLVYKAPQTCPKPTCPIIVRAPWSQATTSKKRSCFKCEPKRRQKDLFGSGATPAKPDHTYGPNHQDPLRQQINKERSRNQCCMYWLSNLQKQQQAQATNRRLSQQTPISCCCNNGSNNNRRQNSVGLRDQGLRQRNPVLGGYGWCPPPGLPLQCDSQCPGATIEYDNSNCQCYRVNGMGNFVLNGTQYMNNDANSNDTCPWMTNMRRPY